MSALATAWEALRTQTPFGDALVARPAAPEVTSRLLAAVDRDGKRHLIVRLLESEPSFGDKKSRGVEVDTRELAVMGETAGRYLDIVCRDAIGHEVFDEIGRELAGVLAAGVEDPGSATRRLVAKWRRFWLSSPAAQLSREEQVGLFAELWFIAYWLMPKIGPPTTIASWQGPLAAVHDFELPRCAIEAKASELSGARRHGINGIDQLDVPDGDTLLLFSLGVRAESNSANTLPMLVEVLRDLLRDEDESIVEFESKLLQSGYSSAHSAEYSELTLRVLHENLYDVSGAFPRVTRRSLVQGLPAGVSSVRYMIDLGGFDSHILARSPAEWRLPRDIG